MPRTTIDLDASVLRELKRRATDEGKSMGDVASEILGSALADKPSSKRPVRLAWTTAKMGPPRVDLEDKEAVRKALDGR